MQQIRLSIVALIFAFTPLVNALGANTKFPELPAILLLLNDGDPVTPVVGCTEPAGPLTAANAAKFLTQATFGPTEATINSLVSQNNLCAWIDQQVRLPISRTLPFVRANSNGSLRTTRHFIWWENALQGSDQLRQRVAFALSQIFVISDRDYELGNSQYGVSDFYDILAENAFGNYRELLERVTLHPTMGIYLGMVRNQKANPSLLIRPDENYAREVLQLFSIGLYDLDQSGQTLPLSSPVDSYSQSTVENFARVFTGWNFADSPGIWSSNDFTSYDKTLTMVADFSPSPPNSFHDTGAKTLLNGRALSSSNGFANPTQRDLSLALDNIASHPNVPPFISKLLIQRLTTSNPSPSYVRRVADVFVNNGQGERGDLRAVVQAILLDDEARRGKAVNANFGKIKEPLLQLTQLWRAFDAQPGPGADGEYRLRAKASGVVDEILGQAVLRSPSVFNFFLPDNLLGSDVDASLVSPEIQILTDANIASMHNAFHSQIYNYSNFDNVGWNVPMQIDLRKAVSLANTPDALLNYLDRLLLTNDMPPAMRSALKSHLEALPNTGNLALDRARDAVFIIIASPQYMVQD